MTSAELSSLLVRAISSLHVITDPQTAVRLTLSNRSLLDSTIPGVFLQDLQPILFSPAGAIYHCLDRIILLVDSISSIVLLIIVLWLTNYHCVH